MNVDDDDDDDDEYDDANDANDESIYNLPFNDIHYAIPDMHIQL